MPDEAEEPAPAAELSLGTPERVVLGALRATGPIAVEEDALPARTGLAVEAVRGALQRLRSKGLANVEEEHREELRLTPRGEVARTSGLPERKLLRALAARAAPMGPDDVASEGLAGEERSAAIGILRRRGFLAEGIPFRSRRSSGPRRPVPGGTRPGGDPGGDDGARRGGRQGPPEAGPDHGRPSFHQALDPLGGGSSRDRARRREPRRPADPGGAARGVVEGARIPGVPCPGRRPVRHRRAAASVRRVAPRVRGDPARPRV